jgi:predicted ABC-type ATPase
LLLFAFVANRALQYKNISVKSLIVEKKRSRNQKGTTMTNIDELAAEWLAVKNEELALTAQRHAIEERTCRVS